MPSAEVPSSKHDAMIELLVLCEGGRALLSHPITNRFDLASAEVARATWCLRVKKMLRLLFGEAAGQMRFAGGSYVRVWGPAPRLSDEVRAFQDVVLEQIASLERVAGLLQQLA